VILAVGGERGLTQAKIIERIRAAANASLVLLVERAGAEPELPVVPKGAVGSALAVVRKAKSEAKVGMRAEVPSITLLGPDAALAHVRSAEADLRAAGKLTGILDYEVADEVAARDVELVPVAKPTA